MTLYNVVSVTLSPPPPPPLSAAIQVEFLTAKYHIYLLQNGRINMCGLNHRNVEYVANAIKDAIHSCPEN